MRLRCGRRKNNMKNQIIIDKKEEHLYNPLAERLSGLNGNHASRGVWGSALRAKSYKSFQNHSYLFPDKMIQIL